MTAIAIRDPDHIHNINSYINLFSFQGMAIQFMFCGSFWGKTPLASNPLWEVRELFSQRSDFVTKSDSL